MSDEQFWANLAGANNKHNPEPEHPKGECPVCKKPFGMRAQCTSYDGLGRWEYSHYENGQFVGTCQTPEVVIDQRLFQAFNKGKSCPQS